MTADLQSHTRDADASDEAPQGIDMAAGRRAFIQSIGLGIAGGAIFGGVGSAAAQSVTDPDILNFALNLEYLEAEFYLRAFYGTGLDSADITGTGRQGNVSGGRKVPFRTTAIRQYAQELAEDERAHVRFLRAGLGNAAVARPAIDLNTSFTAAARAANLVSGTQTFDAFANEDNFLLASFIFEDVGVTAYQGAAPLISNPVLLFSAARILAVEAYHAGLLRTILHTRGFFKEASRISNARDSLDGGTDLDQPIGDADRANLVPSDANGLTFPRTTNQVLNIVYLNAGTRPGGFFPNGTNGTIR